MPRSGNRDDETNTAAVVGKLLVVDDDPSIVKLICRIFQQRGHEVLSGADGEEALGLAVAERPDLIILDLNLPKLDGWEVCRRLKSDEATREIRIVMMTAAHVALDDATIGLGLGADEYVAKPFVRGVLVHNVERLLGTQH